MQISPLKLLSSEKLIKSNEAESTLNFDTH